MKYIVHKKEDSIAEIEIFCETSIIDHALKAEKLGILDDIVSAGFLNIDSNGNIHCGGSSDSLTRKLGRDISSRGDADEALFRLHNRLSKGE